ncbi:type I DNA topoisomerase [Bacteroidales bacterium OttesenSCG-928-C03]|nr:type I DNA topoisomerase [Bacteroidales bacterium OttesenSCG-928-C03]MDL2325950.1 type I DNA topoisomerase [Bacteroidales bacterium OttesenSCG-928-A14]
MSKNLIIVESPAKAKTIKKFISKDYEVISSKGHVRDLPKKDLGIDVIKNFAPKYEILDDKKKLIEEIKSMADKAETVWLATDDDREGEAISWHLMESAKIDPVKVKRIVFHEITKPAIEKALAHPRELDIDLVNAQQARRILDRLVGFELSPVLWKKVKPQLSAGRVQSVAVKLIVEREHDIQAFHSSSQFRIIGDFVSQQNAKTELQAELNKRFEDKDEAKSFIEDCEQATFSIESIEKQPGKRSPSAPFTTSTLQQEAARKLGFSVAKTMIVAQQLYEAGYITYMRTDSLNMSEIALQDAKQQITDLYGAEYHQTRRYTTKNKSAQEAHEAIRPTNMSSQTIPADTFAKRLYELIWKRTIASQMSDAKLERTIVSIPVNNREEKFIATGEVILFQGFLKVYFESSDEEDEEVKGLLPALSNGEKLNYKKIEAMQKYAQPPARYTEASLVKKLEELGIGRPSTYAPTISIIQKREYVVKESRPGKERDVLKLTLKEGKIEESVKSEKYGAEKDKLFPTDIGIVVNDYLQDNFEDIMDYSFTAEVEKKFDDIAEGGIEWQKMLDNFYGKFHESVDQAIAYSTKASGERLLGTDPQSGENVYVKLGRYGPMAQIGELTAEKKPRYARLKSTQFIDVITLEEALDLFKLPRTLEEYNAIPVSIGLGRFGPYVKYGDKFVSIPKGEDPMDVTFERAVELIQQKEKLDKEREPRVLGNYNDKEIAVAVGRYGPYIKYDGNNITLDKGTDISQMTLESAIDYLINAKNKNVLAAYSEDENLKVMNGRYGAYLTNGTDNFRLPKGIIPENITYAEALEITKNTTPTAKKTARKTAKKK